MDRRTLIVSGLAAMGAAGGAGAQPAGQGPGPGPAYGAGSPPPPSPSASANPSYPTGQAETYSRDELVNTVSDFMGVTAEAAGGAI